MKNNNYEYGSDHPTVRYTHPLTCDGGVCGPTSHFFVDAPISATIDGEKYYYMYDGLGSVTELIDEDENVVNRYRYTVFGESMYKEEEVFNPYQYTGRRYDEETGQYYYRARMYSPQQSRFISSDPMGMVDGPNMYAYVRNNPVNFRDPSGCMSVPINLINGGGGGGGNGDTCPGDDLWSWDDCMVYTNDYDTCVDLCFGEYQEGSIGSGSYLKNKLPRADTFGATTKLTWSESEAKAWCNNFQDSLNACGELGCPKAISTCYTAVSLGSVPFCICGYFGGGLIFEFNMNKGLIESIRCRSLSIDTYSGFYGLDNPPTW